MFANAASVFWPSADDARAQTSPPKRRPPPIFIGDAVQPWGSETLLLGILRQDAQAAEDQTDE